MIKNISWRAIRVWQRNMEVYKATWKINFLPPVLEPVMYLFAFGFGLGAMIDDIVYKGVQVSYISFIAPAFIGVSVMYHGFFETTYASFVRMYFQKTFDAILCTPLTIEDIVVGEIFWGATKSLLGAAIMFVVIAAFGILDFYYIIYIIPFAFLFGLTFSSLGMCFTAKLKTIELFNLPVFLFITPMFLFCGVFFPLERMPVWVRIFAEFLPLTYVVEIFRDITLGRSGSAQLGNISIIFCITGISFFLGVYLMRKRLIK